MTDTRLTALTGGIGAGKSIMARILRAMGYAVYDTDNKARRIMSESEAVRRRLIETFGDEIFEEAELRRDRLARLVFGNDDNLSLLNSIVHRAVIDDVVEWRLTAPDKHVFVETAILYTSGLADVVDDVWYVTADEQTRIDRVIKRNGLDREAVVARIRAQDAEAESADNARRHLIINDGLAPLLPRIHELLADSARALTNELKLAR